MKKKKNNDLDATMELDVIQEPEEKTPLWIRILTFVCAAVCVFGLVKVVNHYGGTRPVSAAPETTETPVVDVKEGTCWVMEPTDAPEGLRTLETEPYIAGRDTSLYERTGYPSQWDPSNPNASEKDGEGVIRYGLLGKMGFDGKMLADYEICTDNATNGVKYSAPDHTFYYGQDGNNYRLSMDFSSSKVFSLTKPMAITDTGYCEHNGELSYIRYTPDSGYAYFEPHPWQSEGFNMILPVVDDAFNVTGYAVYDSEGNRMPDGPQGTPIWYRYANGYYAITARDPDSRILGAWNGEGNIALVRASDGVRITDAVYDWVETFTEGYCRVWKSGYWGLVDQDGNEVIPCVFENMSYVCNGNIFLGHDGMCGILSLDKALEEGVTIDTSLFEGYKASQSVKQTGSLTVNVENITLRTRPSTSSSFAGVAYSQETYDYTDCVVNGGYTWYCIGENVWLADCDGEWLNVTKN